jgi:hypothetical protein
LYVIGKTGTGKSTLLENMAIQDLERGNGLALIDPHGDLVARIAARIPESRRDDVIYLDATDPSQPFGYNPLRHVREDRIALAASGMMDVFKKMWPDAWGVRMEHILRNVLMALLEQPDATLHDVLRIFSDKEFRRSVGRSLRNETASPSPDRACPKCSAKKVPLAPAAAHPEGPPGRRRRRPRGPAARAAQGANRGRRYRASSCFSSPMKARR